jgi:hypothetical protein
MQKLVVGQEIELIESGTAVASTRVGLLQPVFVESCVCGWMLVCSDGEANAG